MLCDRKIGKAIELWPELCLIRINSRDLVFIIKSLNNDSIMYGVHLNNINLHRDDKLLSSWSNDLDFCALPSTSHIKFGLIIEQLA